jgi:2,4-dienoyl-CoA reductase-like NADH-dependent reductase (Old Yellow Enzyme family)
MDSAIAQPLTLKCGLTLKNRLVKAAMAELMADKNGLPAEASDKIYAAWGRGEWGMVLTGMWKLFTSCQQMLTQCV